MKRIKKEMLRALDKGGYLALEKLMSEWLAVLEYDGSVRVAWCEGDSAEDAMLTFKGKAYVNKLKRKKPVDWKAIAAIFITIAVVTTLILI